MQNGYFRLVNRTESFGLAVFQPLDGGEEISIKEVEEYLGGLNIPYDKSLLEKAVFGNKDDVIILGNGCCPEIPETYSMKVSEDGMTAYARFLPASENGRRMTKDDFLKDLRFRRISYGIDMEILERHFNGNGVFCTDILIAKGDDPVQGCDARIEYLFDTDIQVHPKTREDGSVDFFHMTTINHCKKGEVLARIIPEDPGKEGFDIFGRTIKPRNVKKESLKFGRNICLSEDKYSITSEVDGHVSLTDGKVFVSSVYEVKNVDVSTGNLDFDGSIEIGGDVMENYEVKAGGDVIINGTVEGATIIASGNIIIAKGMNGMGKGLLQAGGNVVIKFVENANIQAGGYVQTEAILHSKVSAGTEIVVEGRRGMIAGGYIQARTKVDAKTIGAAMGGNTVLEVGTDPGLKEKCSQIQKTIAENSKTIRNAENILLGYQTKIKRGIQVTPSQVKYMKTVAKMITDKNEENQGLNQEKEKLQQMMKPGSQAEIIIRDEIYPGTTIIIGEAVKTIQTGFHYCRFIREHGEIIMTSI